MEKQLYNLFDFVNYFCSAFYLINCWFSIIYLYTAKWQEENKTNNWIEGSVFFIYPIFINS